MVRLAQVARRVLHKFRQVPPVHNTITARVEAPRRRGRQFRIFGAAVLEPGRGLEPRRLEGQSVPAVRRREHLAALVLEALLGLC